MASSSSSHQRSISKKGPWTQLPDSHVEEVIKKAVEACNLSSESKSFVVLTGDEDWKAESIRLSEVTDAISKSPTEIALAYCSGLVFAERCNLGSELKAKLCVIRSDEPMVIDLDYFSSKIPDPTIVDRLLRCPDMKVLVSSVTQICHLELIEEVKEFVGSKFGKVEKSRYVKMVDSLTSRGLFGKLETVEIWVMLKLKDRLMEIFKGMPLAKEPTSLDNIIPSASVTHPTPAVRLAGKAVCSTAEGSNSKRRSTCGVFDLNAILVEEEEEEAANHLKKRKANSAGVAPEVMPSETAGEE